MRRLRVQVTILLALLGLLFERVRQLSGRWQALRPVVEGMADEYRGLGPDRAHRAGTRKARGARAAALVAARGNADQHFRRLWDRQTALEDQLARAQGACPQPGPDL